MTADEFLFFNIMPNALPPEVFIIVSFGLSHRLNSPRIAIAVEPYPNRWTHHMIVFEAEQLDDELIGWLREAYDFAQTKERRSSL